MSTKTTAIIATAGLALVPAAAFADRPDEPGKQGRETAAERRADNEQRQAERRAQREERQEAREEEREERREAREDRRRGKRVGFTLSGIGLTSLPVANGELTGPLTLDVTSANKHARRFLDLTREEIAGTQTFAVGSANDDVRVRFVGLTATDTLQATDRVKVIGKVTRVRKGDETTVRTLDIRKIVVKRGTADDQDETETETQG
jgi:hypothetical protein